MYINPKNVQKWIGNFEFFLVWKFGDVVGGNGIRSIFLWAWGVVG
jgi:hypothetical protein